MKNLAFHSLLRWKITIRWENVLFELGTEGLRLQNRIKGRKCKRSFLSVCDCREVKLVFSATLGRPSPFRAGSIPRPSAPGLRLRAPGPGAWSRTEAAACASPSASCRLSVLVRGLPGWTRCCLWCCPANRVVSPETARHERSPLITKQGRSELASRLGSLRSPRLLDLTRKAMWTNAKLDV